MRLKRSDEIILDIKRLILAGTYTPGDKLPSERELSTNYNVSRVPVREAIAQLSRENVIRSESKMGNFIAESCDAKLLSQDILQYSLIDKRLLHESLLTRQLVESYAAKLAARHATKEDIEDIQNYLFSSTEEFTKLKSTERNSFFKEDYNFHQQIAVASHSEVVQSYMSIIDETISTHQFCSLQTDTSFDKVPNAHFKIFNAILSRDEDLAWKEMNGHLQRVIDLIESTLVT